MLSFLLSLLALRSLCGWYQLLGSPREICHEGTICPSIKYFMFGFGLSAAFNETLSTDKNKRPEYLYKSDKYERNGLGMRYHPEFNDCWYCSALFHGVSYRCLARLPERNLLERLSPLQTGIPLSLVDQAPAH